MRYIIAVAAIQHKDDFLLLRRSESRTQEPEKWEFVSGFPRPGEKYADAALREVREETGLGGRIDAQFDPLIVREGKDSWIINPFLVGVDKLLGFELSYEHTSHAWVALEEISKYDCVAGLDEIIALLKDPQSARVAI